MPSLHTLSPSPPRRLSTIELYVPERVKTPPKALRTHICPYSFRFHIPIRMRPPVPETTPYPRPAQAHLPWISRADSEQTHLVSCQIPTSQALQQCKGHILRRVRGRELLFGVGMRHMGSLLQPAAVGSAYLLKSSCCLASLPHFASTDGDAMRLEAAGSWQQARSWPLLRTDELGSSWWHAMARANVRERIVSADATRRIVCTHASRTVTVWHRCMDALLFGPCGCTKRII